MIYRNLPVNEGKGISWVPGIKVWAGMKSKAGQTGKWNQSAFPAVKNWQKSENNV